MCGHVYDEDKEGKEWQDLSGDWECPICQTEKALFDRDELSGKVTPSGPDTDGPAEDRYLGEWERTTDTVEVHMAAIHRMAETGVSISEPMRASGAQFSWDDILIKGAQLANLPLNEDIPVKTQTVIGPKAKEPLVIEIPLYITHMSFGALSREAKLALAKGSAEVKTAMCSGEGGILTDAMESAYKYIFEYVPNQYSVTDENLKRVDAVEIKIGQSAKPGMGGHLPGDKVTSEIAAIRGSKENQDIISPAHFPDIRNREELKAKVAWLREKSGGKPIGIKIAAGHIEADLAVALYAEPDFITIDGRAGGTGSAPKFVKGSASVPTVFALSRARRFLDKSKVEDVSLIITGGLRVSSDFAKALALGADGIALGTSAMMAIGCQQYRICNTGKCPVGISSQDPELRARLDVDWSAARLANFFRVSTEDLKAFARMTGKDSVHSLSTEDLCTVTSEISSHTPIEHV
jgi:glutamate synthase domain-containing protein 2/rubredoxin